MNVKLEVQLTIKDLFLNQTVYELAKYVQRQKNELLDTSIEFNYLLQIKKGGDKIPLYIVSGGGGTVLKFRDFAQRLDERQPVYGLQQPNKVEEVEDFPETVEGIAATYIEEILQQNPHGPYALSGHCVGGVIAFEMAKQLEMLGKKVTLLAMFDTIIRTPVRLETSSFKNLYHIPLIVKSRISKFYWKAKFETYLLRNYTKHAIGYKVNKLKSLAQKNKRDKSKKDPNVTFRELELGFLQATQKYQITPYNGDIIAFYAEEHYRFLDVEKNVRFRRFTIDDSTKNIWKKYAKSFSVYEIEGEHSTIFVSKHAKEFSRILQAELDKYNQ
jgi:thioesterase domain-containing protein